MQHSDRPVLAHGPATASLLGVTSKQRINPIDYVRIPFGSNDRAEQRLVEALTTTLGGTTRIVPIGRARMGIHLLTKYAMQSTGRPRVLMSPYTVPDVVNMVVLAGAEPVFYDNEPGSTRCDIDALRAELNDQTACVFITHYHVNENRIDALRGLCRQRGAFLFDDCALTFGGRSSGRPMGTLTDASVFSFSSFKLLNFFWGGMITTGDARLAEWLANSVNRWPRLRLKDYARQARVCLTYDVATRPEIFRHLVFPTLRRKADANSAAQTLEHVRVESVAIDPTLTSRPHAAAFGEWLRKLRKVDAWLAHRRAIASVYHSILAEHTVCAPLTPADLEEGCFVNYPVIVDPAERDRICLTMMRKGYDVGRNLYPNVQRQPGFSDIRGKSTNIDALVAGSLYLPTHFGVSTQYAQAIAGALDDVIRGSS